ncbi:hypothetical protein FHR81_001642 [Actinoalloteichus hoggarensis]|uniref:DUF8017 domain-containing protein n=1 Tax=Actinoalloteichus hoggarensis TaxID=1470176 RepID=A0A221W0T2_9PSEU|nr:hypothetical protein [Actinoalloteichus hoggarensis]ASO19374.1 hypothetical protein AHOG_08650 [Actinoalloteichus hoggarensis]MBB5920612.1 hypothetical protein [Actinoalloteichus hoggarensis]
MTSWSHGGQSPDDSGAPGSGGGYPTSGSFPAQGPGAGYGGSYGGLGVYGSSGGEPPSRGPGKGRAVLIGGLSVVLVAVVTTTIILLVNGGGRGSTPVADQTTTQDTPAPTSESAADQATSAPPEEPPHVLGWQVVRTERGALYDVPRDWELSEQDITYGDVNQGGVALESATTLERNTCAPGFVRASAGVTLLRDPDLAAAATDAARRLAENAYSSQETPPEVEVSEPEPITLAADTAAQYVRATATITDPVECGSPEGSIHVVTIPTTDGNGALALAAVGDQGVDNSISPEDMRLIIESFRPPMNG